MSLESATYISQLNPSNPTAGDNASQGDDHLRLLKSVLQSTFPNLSGAATATQAQLNAVVGTSGFTKITVSDSAPGGTLDNGELHLEY